MARAIFNGEVIAESESTEMVEGNHYFPPASVKREFFKETNHHTTCPWKGKANYFTLTVNGETLEDGAWTYPNTTAKVIHIRDFVAFYRQVKIEA